MYEWRFRTRTAGRLEQVERTARVRVEIVEWNRGRYIVRGLGRRVDDHIRPQLSHKPKHSLPVPHVQFMMMEISQLRLQPPLVPPRVARGTEKHGALIVIDAMDFKSSTIKIEANVRSDQSGRACDEGFFHQKS